MDRYCKKCRDKLAPPEYASLCYQCIEEERTPPPLQPGDAVWVRAVVRRISGETGDRAYVTIPLADSPVCHYPFEVSLSVIRRIEGEVKP